MGGRGACPSRENVHSGGQEAAGPCGGPTCPGRAWRRQACSTKASRAWAAHLLLPRLAAGVNSGTCPQRGQGLGLPPRPVPGCQLPSSRCPGRWGAGKMGQVLLSSRSSRWTPGLYLEGAKSPHCAPSSAQAGASALPRRSPAHRAWGGPFKCSPAGRHRGQHRSRPAASRRCLEASAGAGAAAEGGDGGSARGPAQIAPGARCGSTAQVGVQAAALRIFRECGAHEDAALWRTLVPTPGGSGLGRAARRGKSHHGLLRPGTPAGGPSHPQGKGCRPVWLPRAAVRPRPGCHLLGVGAFIPCHPAPSPGLGFRMEWGWACKPQDRWGEGAEMGTSMAWGP